MSNHTTPDTFGEASNHTTPGTFGEASNHTTPGTFGEVSNHTTPGIFLVNRDNPIPPGYRESVEIVAVEVEEDFSVPLERETAEKYLELREYLLSRGIAVDAVSGYRSQGTQERIWNESMAAHGEAHTRRYVAEPGYSEHQTGLALDLTLYDDRGNIVEDDDSEAFDKLLPHYHKFGFILRYPAGKEHVTGYSYEPWHIRYVGIEAAREIYENDLTLEEYVSSACEGSKRV